MALRTPLSVTPHLYMGDSTGRPLDKGVVYFGEQDKDPEFYPINLFSDDALTKPLAQPVHTKGGYLYDKGDMVEPHAKELIYSVKVLDSYGRKVFYKGAMMRNSWNDDVIEQINTAIIGSADVARRVATDITNDAINNTAIEGGVLADTFVTMTANTDTIATNLRAFRSRRLDVIDFGMVAGEGVAPAVVAANTLALQKAVNSGKVLFPTNQVFEVSGDVVGEIDTYIEGNNSKLIFLKGYLYLRGNVSEVPNSLMTPLLAGSSKIHTNADFAEGDILNIVDTTFGSFSRHRSSYFAGQHFRVTRQDGEVTTVDGVADFNYLDTASNANVKIYKIKPIKAVINNLSVESSAGLNSESAYTVRLRGCLGLEVSNVTSKGGDIASLFVERCVGGDITNTSAYQYGISDDGTEYGLSISDSENIDVFGGSYYGTRHGVAMGGSGFGGCNNIVVDGANISSSEDVGGSYSADFHGNVRNSYYKNCKILNGASLSGFSNGYVGCDITSWSRGGVILLGELVGGVYKVHGNKLRARENPDWDSILKAHSSVVIGKIDNNYTIELEKNEIYGSVTTKYIVLTAVNKENVKLIKPSIILKDNRYYNCESLVALIFAASVGTDANTTPTYREIAVSGSMEGLPPTAELLKANALILEGTKHLAPSYAKRLVLNMVSGNINLGLLVDHPFNYGHLLYTAQATINTELKSGTSSLIPNVSYLSATRIRVGANNSDGGVNQTNMEVPMDLIVGGTYVYS